jgi:hypothetical protein
VAKARNQVLTLCILVAAFRLHAGIDDAKADYMRGLKLELAKNYVAALAAYKAALAEYPSYVYADRQLANCYYYLGDKDDSARECGIYLAAKPDDAQVRAFADRLRRDGDISPEAEEGLEPPGSNARPYQNSLYIGLSVAEVMNEMSDVQQLSPNTAFLDQTGTAGKFKIGVLLEEGFWFEGSFDFGPDRSYTLQDPLTSPQASIYLSERTFSVEPGFRFPLGSILSLGAGVALGYSFDSLLYSPSNGPTQVYDGSGFVYTPEFKLSLALGKIGFDIDAGYHNSKISPLRDNNGYPLTVADLNSGAPENWTMDNSGYFLRMGLLYYFNSPMPEKPEQP